MERVLGCTMYQLSQFGMAVNRRNATDLRLMADAFRAAQHGSDREYKRYTNSLVQSSAPKKKSKKKITKSEKIPGLEHTRAG